MANDKIIQYTSLDKLYLDPENPRLGREHTGKDVTKIVVDAYGLKSSFSAGITTLRTTSSSLAARCIATKVVSPLGRNGRSSVWRRKIPVPTTCWC